MNADLLIILSDIDGLYTGNPREDANAKRISYVEDITDEMLGFSKGAGSKLGTGGMYTKTTAMQIFEQILDQDDVGTFFAAK